MGFKADTSFLKFLSMGAAGVKQVIAQLRTLGFEPIELERYCTSNKIWTTKVKRLRLPDLLCVRTGLRIEVRAKSELKIRMSDAPANPDRRWDSGLRGNDVCAFIACREHNGTPVPAAQAAFFIVDDLRASVETSTLGSPKSVSEGAERDRTWASTVPARSGVVDYIDADTIRTTQDADEERPARSQTYKLRGKFPYVAVGDRFEADASILAGTPAQCAQLAPILAWNYTPAEQLSADAPVDRYAAVKSMPYRADQRGVAKSLIEHRLDVEDDERVLLEAAGAGAALGSEKARELIEEFVWSRSRADLRMEAVFILTELRSPAARDILLRVANDPTFSRQEVRQAAVWGLGKAGLKCYSDLIPFLADADRDVALHAISAFAADAPTNVVDRLVAALTSPEEDLKFISAASEALRIVGGAYAISALARAAKAMTDPHPWILATLGRMPSDSVITALSGDALLDRLASHFLLSSGTNWLADDMVDIDLKFLLKQSLY